VNISFVVNRDEIIYYLLSDDVSKPWWYG